MSRSSDVYREPTPRSNWKRISSIGASLLILSGLIGAMFWYFSPPGQRWAADQTSAPAEVGITEIDVLEDEALNHVFAPTVTQVEVGTEITWHFKEIDEDGFPVPHNVVFEDEESPVLSTGIFSKTFNEPGTYQYTCTLHPYMDGVVIVTE